MAKFRRIRIIRIRDTRALTLFELMIGTAISSLVMVAVMFILYISTLTVKELYGPTRSRSARMSALNQVRFRLCDAKIGSCVVSDPDPDSDPVAYHRIQFDAPTLGSGIVSEFYFSPEDRTLYYDADINNSDPQKVARGPINITFTLGSTDLDVPDHLIYLGTDAVVTIFVQTAAELAYSNVDLRDGETVIYLRNI